MKCLICNKDFGERYIPGSHFKTHNITGKEYYDKFLKKSDEGICQNCGSNTKYHGKISRGYSRYCSRTCWLKTDTHREIVRNTMKNKIWRTESKEKLANYRRGKIQSKESIEKQHATRKLNGSNRPNLGKKWSEETKRKMSIGQAKYREEHPEVVKIRFKNRRHKIITVPEKIVKNIIEELNIPLSYNGDFSNWIGNRNPDFLDKNSKKIIEVFGDWWHGEKYRCSHNDTDSNEVHENKKIEYYRSLGYDCIVLWEGYIHEHREQLYSIINEFYNRKIRF